MSVSFSQIPRTRRLPGSYVEVDSSRAVRGLPGMPHKALAIGQRLAIGTVAALTPVLITDPVQAAEAFGAGSMLHAMCERFRDANDTTEFWAIGLDDAAAGVAAVKSVTFGKADADAAFGAGTANLYIGGRRVRVAVAADDTAAEIVAALVAAATDPMVPAVLSIDGGTPEKLLVTAKHEGAAGNDIDVRLNFFGDERAPANLTAAIAPETTGAGDPEIAAALAAVDGDWWTEIVCPYLDGANYAAMDEFLTARFDALDQRDGQAFSARTGTVSQLFAWGDSVNSPFITTLPVEKRPAPPWEIAAAYAGIASFQLALDPARQLKTLELPGILPPAPVDRFTGEEFELLLGAGISALDSATGATRLWRCITNYQLSPAGAEDMAYFDLTTLSLIAYLRWSQNNRIELRFPRHKLASNGTRFAPGQAVVTPEIIEGELIALYREWETAGLVENAQFFIDRLIVERDGGDPNRLNSLQTPDLINNFRIFAAKIQFRL